MKQKTKKRVAVAGAVLGTTLAGALLARKVLRGRTALEHLAETPLLRGPTHAPTPPAVPELPEVSGDAYHAAHIKEATSFINEMTKLARRGINLEKSKDFSSKALYHARNLFSIGQHLKSRHRNVALDLGKKLVNLFPETTKNT